MIKQLKVLAGTSVLAAVLLTSTGFTSIAPEPKVETVVSVQVSGGRLG